MTNVRKEGHTTYCFDEATQTMTVDTGRRKLVVRRGQRWKSNAPDGVACTVEGIAWPNMTVHTRTESGRHYHRHIRQLIHTSSLVEDQKQKSEAKTAPMPSELRAWIDEAVRATKSNTDKMDDLEYHLDNLDKSILDLTEAVRMLTNELNETIPFRERAAMTSGNIMQEPYKCTTTNGHV